MNPVAKTAVMIAACVVVIVSQTFILLGFLKKLKKIETDFWGESAEKAKEDLGKARAEEQKKAAAAAEDKAK
jgi:hypothetical protein